MTVNSPHIPPKISLKFLSGTALKFPKISPKISLLKFLSGTARQLP